MSLGSQALLLIRLNAAAADWVRVDDLAAHFGWPADQVRRDLFALEEKGMVRTYRDVFASGTGLITAAKVKAAKGQPCA